MICMEMVLFDETPIREVDRASLHRVNAIIGDITDVPQQAISPRPR
jgi:hypothetical protein